MDMKRLRRIFRPRVSAWKKISPAQSDLFHGLARRSSNPFNKIFLQACKIFQKLSPLQYESENEPNSHLVNWFLGTILDTWRTEYLITLYWANTAQSMFLSWEVLKQKPRVAWLCPTSPSLVSFRSEAAANFFSTEQLFTEKKLPCPTLKCQSGWNWIFVEENWQTETFLW